MKNIMKLLGTMTIVALLVGGVVAIPAVAVTPRVTVSIDAPDTAAPDCDFTANVNISEVTNFNACNYDVTFDASVLRLDNVAAGLIGSTTIPVDVYSEVESGTWRVIQNVPGTGGVTGFGYLTVLHFHVIGTGGPKASSTITLSNGMLSNNLAEEITATWTGDSVEVAESSVPVSVDAPDTAAPASDFTVNVNISEVTDFDACNYDVTFDASVLRLDNVAAGLIGSTTIPVDVYNEVESGTYRVIQNVPGLDGVTGTGYLAVLHFHVVGADGDTSNITLSNGMLSNNMAEEITATWTGDSVEVVESSVPVSVDAPDEAAPASDFTANVNIGEVTDFDACNYDVTFDASVLQLDDVAVGLIGSTEIPVDVYSEVESGTWRIVQNVAGTEGVTGTGYLAVLHFHVVGADGDISNITLSNGVLSNNLAEEIAATWTGDSINIADTTPPSVTITPLAPDPTENDTPTFTGTATDTSSSISTVEYKVDDGSWTVATASDDAFDSLSEDYTFTTVALTEGEHTVYVRATDAASNTTAEADYASDSFTVQAVIPGDANGDGTVDVLDITRVERVITGLDTETPGADANGDGVINVLDVTLIERMIAGLS